MFLHGPQYSARVQARIRHYLLACAVLDETVRQTVIDHANADVVTSQTFVHCATGASRYRNIIQRSTTGIDLAEFRYSPQVWEILTLLQC